MLRHAMTPLARWLKETRLAQTNPETGRAWTQDYFLARMKASTGWAPAYPNYNAIEQGKTSPRSDTVAKLVAFWATVGVPEPDLSPLPDPISLEERRVRAAERANEIAEEGNALLRDQIAATREQNQLLAAVLLRDQLPADEIKSLQGLVSAFLSGEAANKLPAPTPGHRATQAR